MGFGFRTDNTNGRMAPLNLGDTSKDEKPDEQVWTKHFELFKTELNQMRELRKAVFELEDQLILHQIEDVEEAHNSRFLAMARSSTQDGIENYESSKFKLERQIANMHKKSEMLDELVGEKGNTRQALAGVLKRLSHSMEDDDN